MQTEYNTLTKDVSGSELKKMLINSCWQFFLNLLFFIKDKTWKILEYLETEKNSNLFGTAHFNCWMNK